MKLSQEVFALHTKKEIQLYSFDTLTYIKSLVLDTISFYAVYKFVYYQYMYNKKILYYRSKNNTLHIINLSTGAIYTSLRASHNDENSFIDRYNDDTFYTVDKGIITLYHFSY